MKRIAYFKDCFDPITEKHLEFAKQLVKKYDLDELYFVIDEKGDADILHRFNMLKRALYPYRKLIPVAPEYKLPENLFYYCFEASKEASDLVKQGHFSGISYSNKCYIMEYGLYLDSIIKSNLNPHRYAHSVSVAKLCKEIADGNHLDSFKAYKIGMLHDIAKNLSAQELKYYIDIYSPYEKDYSFQVWHQYVGAFILKHDFKLNDRQSLKAIRHHCLGDNNDCYSKIIFIADKLDPSRGYDSSKEIALALKDVDQAFEVVKKQNKEYLEKEGVK